MKCPRCKRQAQFAARQTDTVTGQVVTMVICDCGYQAHQAYKGPNYNPRKDRKIRNHAQDNTDLSQEEVSSGCLGESQITCPRSAIEQSKRKGRLPQQVGYGNILKGDVANAEVVAGNEKPAVLGTRSSFVNSSLYVDVKADTSEQIILDYGT